MTEPADTLNIDFFNGIASTYDGGLVNRAKDRELDSEFSRLMDEGNRTAFKHCLDLGSGTGNFGALLKERGWVYRGVDGAPKMIEQAKRKGLSGTELVQFNLDSSPLPAFEGMKFSAVTSFATLIYLRNACATMKEMINRTAPGGVTVFTSFEVPSERAGVIRLQEVEGSIRLPEGQKPGPNAKTKTDKTIYAPSTRSFEDALESALGSQWREHVKIKPSGSCYFRTANSGKLVKPRTSLVIVQKPR